MCKNYLILYIFLLTMVNLHTANAHHELEDQNIVDGEENYQAHCASCHGVDLEGQPNWRTMKADGSLPAPPHDETCLLYTSPSPRDLDLSRMPSSA